MDDQYEVRRLPPIAATLTGDGESKNDNHLIAALKVGWANPTDVYLPSGAALVISPT